jgi:HK97 family phage prohead protease
MKLETRNSPIEFELRGQDGPKPGTVVGYAAVFDSLSEDLGGFQERLEPTAFNGSMGREYFALYSHDMSKVLGSSRSGTLKASPDTKGLNFEVELPDTTFGRDLWVSLTRGDVQGASFGFTVSGDEWNLDGGMPIRTITQIERLFEVSITAMPAYPSTSVATASLRSFQAQDDALHRHIDAERRARIIRLSGIG